MVKKITPFFTCLILIFVFKTPVFAQGITINDLVVQSSEYDQHIVTIEAEVIGEALERGSYTWINVNDKTNAIGIWMPIELLSKITVYGDYFHTGDVIRISGTFNHSCLEHGGEMDIHATQIVLVTPGKVRKPELSPWKFTFAIIFFTLALALAWRYKSYLDMMKSKYKLRHFE